MPEQTNTEPAQPVEGGRDERDEKDFERAGEHKDVWTAGQSEDASAGEEFIGEERMDETRPDDVDLEAQSEARDEERLQKAADDGELQSDNIDVELPDSARRNDINDKTR